ncbi:PPK2 family polyphosphate kinase [Ottowia sp.]|uniref:PPK2 family polyphosphate kinase n=1 Tax=Ottowia sp. TaxID=1898956 RepID=UPI002B9A04DE|nr:PPK2 family polyphosphate kinase [Ottowia sp.]HPK34046.1 polyphosphate--nucleotide phosphotransferase [Ottowia sp.]HPR45214.1 polyphosphate--nucleotide phosphotransferase [Ottowia sp.]HRW73983.1 polyphosphate--nucleotide phosphotransferase [Ottowia sp.]
MARWQVPAGGKGFALSRCDPSAKPMAYADKDDGKARVAELASEIDRLQDIFYADGRFALLVVLQGMDAAGKDGTIRAVFKETSPLGVRTVGWKAPSDIERAHDYLWRIHQQMPRKSEFMVFNRSHYEDVLVPVVNGWIDAATTRQRYAQINDFERLLSENGTVIMKFMLHIGPEEQRKRLQERVDDPTKHWKFSMGDLDVRKQWQPYQQAYENLLRATSTAWAPWTVVPADSKTHRNLMIATLVRDRLKALKLRYPPDDPQLKGLIVQ